LFFVLGPLFFVTYDLLKCVFFSVSKDLEQQQSTSQLDSSKRYFYHASNFMTLSFNQRVKLSDDVLISDLQGESVILNVNSQRYYGLNKIGTRFLTLLRNSQSIESAFDALLLEYDVEADELRGDLTDLLVELREAGLVKIYD